MPGNYSHTTRATGTVLTATIYNTDHQNHIDNQTPAGTDDYSGTVGQMQSVVDPGEVGTESLATSLQGELERLRNIIKEITGKTQWYETPSVNLGNVKAAFVLTPESAIFPASNFPQLVKNSDTNWTSYTLDYDQTISESAFWYVTIPTNAPTFTGANIDLYYRTTVTTGTFIASITTLTRSSGEAWDTAGVTDTTAADTVPATAGQVGRVTKVLTTTGWGLNEVLLIKIARDISDTAAADIKLINAVLRLT